MKKIYLFVPLVLIVIISIFLFIYLLQNKHPNKPPSALLNKNLPNFNIVNLFDENQKLSNSNLKGKFTLINFFASWCAPCKVEHPLFFYIKNEYPNLYLVGINFKDKKIQGKEYLKNNGNPYDFTGIDEKGLVGLDFGVFGLPETFLINNEGIIIYKHLGPLTKEIIKNEIITNIE
tara:strand:- start:438 stop:965 length:528 start_codon:yes stop_codon:yes gene_type:complete